MRLGRGNIRQQVSVRNSEVIIRLKHISTICWAPDVSGVKLFTRYSLSVGTIRKSLSWYTVENLQQGA